MDIRELDSEVSSDISNTAEKITFNTNMTEQEIIDEIVEKIQEGGCQSEFEGSSSDALDIVIGADWPEAECVDFTGMTNSLDCLNQEAVQIYSQAYDSRIYDAAKELAESAMEMIEKAIELGFDGEFETSSSSIYGWAAHNYETYEGTCVWSDEPGHYNPELLEGELWAIEKSIGGITIGVAWTPEKDEE